MINQETKELLQKCNWWNWRTTVEIIRSSEIIDNERCNILSDGFGELTISECRQISQFIKQNIIPKLSSEDRIKLNLTVTDEPDDGRIYGEGEWEENYSTSLIWLEKFIKILDETETVLFVSQ